MLSTRRFKGVLLAVAVMALSMSMTSAHAAAADPPQGYAAPFAQPVDAAAQATIAAVAHVRADAAIPAAHALPAAPTAKPSMKARKRPALTDSPAPGCLSIREPERLCFPLTS